MVDGMPARRRHSTLRLLRALWRYRGRLEQQGSRYQVELATAVRTALDERVAGRVALGGYRLAMRLLGGAALACGALALVAGLLLWQADPWLLLLDLPLLVLTGLLAWWRLTWGAPLAWLEEHADPERTIPLAELPERLRALARETRDIAHVPARLSEELDALAGDVPQRTQP